MLNEISRNAGTPILVTFISAIGPRNFCASSGRKQPDRFSSSLGSNGTSAVPATGILQRTGRQSFG